MIRYLILLYSKESDALTFHRRIFVHKDQKKKNNLDKFNIRLSYCC